MSKTLEQLRADLARGVGRFSTGIATDGSVSTIVDNQAFQVYTELNALAGVLAYILTAGDASPEGESRRATSHNHANWTITVDPDYGAAVATGDVYELYHAPLTLAQWDEAINTAILEAWPEVWAIEVEDIETIGLERFTLATTADSVLSVHFRGMGALQEYAAQLLPRLWHLSGAPGVDLVLNLRNVPPPGFELSVRYKARYPELTAGASTDLDYPYIMAAAKAHLHEMLSGEARGQADAARNLQLMNYWRDQADQRKRALNAALLGIDVAVEKQGRKAG